jgi:hypothetical protein
LRSPRKLSGNRAAYSCAASIGTPRTTFPTATPYSSAATRLPRPKQRSQTRRQRGEFDLPRNSNEAARAISAATTSIIAR